MSSLVHRIAVEVISKSSREHPADAVLREALQLRRVPSREETREISTSVFSYFRWLGWLDSRKSLPSRIEYALELARAFEQRPESFSDEKLVERVVPDWVREEMEVAPAWARAIQREAKLWLRSRRGDGRTLVKKLGAAKIENNFLPEAVLYKGEEDLFRRPEFHAGEFEIQDVSSQLVGLLCAPKAGETWWDACAGEGGKLLHLSDLMENKGLIWASDRAKWRLEKLKRRAARAKAFNYRAVVWEGGTKLPTKTKFDGVLVDAPCSGIGTWQRNPHARWTTTLQDVRELSDVQRQLLAHVAPSVKPGGKLIYSVCTLTRAETEDVAARFNEIQSDFEKLTLPEIIPIKQRDSFAKSDSNLTIWPQDLGGNGMYVAAWRRKH